MSRRHGSSAGSTSSPAAEQAIALAQDHPGPGDASGRKPRRARTDNEHVAMMVDDLVTVRVTFVGGSAEAGGPPDGRLVELFPAT